MEKKKLQTAVFPRSSVNSYTTFMVCPLPMKIPGEWDSVRVMGGDSSVAVGASHEICWNLDDPVNNTVLFPGQFSISGGDVSVSSTMKKRVNYTRYCHQRETVNNASSLLRQHLTFSSDWYMVGNKSQKKQQT